MGRAFVLDSSRRARGFALYATLRSLGPEGIAHLVERCCDHARRLAELVGGEAWMGGTTWQDRAAMRVSVSNWSTSEADVVRTGRAILRAAREVQEVGR